MVIKTSYQLLSIEDDPFTRSIGQYCLNSTFDLTTCRNGLEAKNWLLAGHRPAGILIDLRMLLPGMGGLIDWIRDQPTCTQIPILVLASADDSGLLLTLLKSGVDDFIISPVNSLDLKARIMAQLRWI